MHHRTCAALAEQFAFLPPLTPLHVQTHWLPETDTPEALPTEQRLEDGADFSVWPFEPPHAPLMADVALQAVGVTSVHVQVQFVPTFVTGLAVPDVHKLVVGAAGNPLPFEVPQTPGVKCDLQTSTVW